MTEGRLTLAFVRGTDAPGKYYDAFGLILIVSPGGAKRWVQRLTVNGRRRDIAIGSALTLSPAGARAIAKKNRDLARAGGNPLAGTPDRPAPAPRQGTTLAAYSRALYLQALARGDRRAARRPYGILLKHLHPLLGRRLLGDLTPAMIRAALMRVREENASIAMKARTELIELLNRAIADGILTSNAAAHPDASIPAPLQRSTAEGDVRSARILAELPAFLVKLENSRRRPNLLRLIRFTLLTLRSPQECRLARWEQIDLVAGTWTFPLRQKEGAEIQQVALHDEQMAVLRECLPLARVESGSWVFPSSSSLDRPYKENASYKAMRDLEAEIELLDFRRVRDYWVNALGGDGSIEGWIRLLREPPMEIEDEDGDRGL